MPQKIVIEYTIYYDLYIHGAMPVRKTKEFSDPYAARRFWIMKDKQGKKPKIIGDRSNG